ncbi:MAG: tyrosine-type recombinase/integrase [Acidimicrobiales bacterium]
MSAKAADEAKKKLRAVQRQVDDGLPAPDDRMTVKQLLARWENEVLRHQVATNAFDNYKSIADHHLVPTLGSKRVSKLTPADVDALTSAKLDSGLSASTVRRMRAVLSQALDQAVRWGVVARNVVSLTKGPKMKRKEGRGLTPAQAKLLLKSVRGYRLEALYITLLYLGLRSGEALGLRWSSVDLAAGTLTVQRALRRERNKLFIGEVKTATSRRSVNLPEPVVKSLRRHKSRQAKERRIAGSSWTDMDLVFPNEVGTPIDPSNFRRDFNAACERAGLGHWHPHELRHSAASLMLAQNVPLEVVADILGHSSIRMTADVYGHIRSPQREAAAKAMANALR